MPFKKISSWSETQTASSKIWSQVIDSIFFDDNRYNNPASKYVYINFPSYGWMQKKTVNGKNSPTVKIFF